MYKKSICHVATFFLTFHFVECVLMVISEEHRYFKLINISDILNHLIKVNEACKWHTSKNIQFYKDNKCADGIFFICWKKIALSSLSNILYLLLIPHCLHFISYFSVVHTSFLIWLLCSVKQIYMPIINKEHHRNLGEWQCLLYFDINFSIMETLLLGLLWNVFLID